MISYRTGYYINLFCVLAIAGIAFYEHFSVIKIINSIESESYVNVSFDGNVSHCGNSSFSGIVYCVNDYVRSIYKYNVTDDSLNLSIDDLRSIGGDCYDWSKFYSQQFSFYNLSNEIIVYPVNDTNRHAFVLVYDVNNYCILDQRDVKCTILG